MYIYIYIYTYIYIYKSPYQYACRVQSILICTMAVALTESAPDAILNTSASPVNF